jgi:hypothetical protein
MMVNNFTNFNFHRHIGKNNNNNNIVECLERNQPLNQILFVVFIIKNLSEMGGSNLEDI